MFLSVLNVGEWHHSHDRTPNRWPWCGLWRHPELPHRSGLADGSLNTFLGWHLRHATSLCEPSSGIEASLRSSWLNCSTALAGFHTLSPWQRSHAIMSLRTYLCGCSLEWQLPHSRSLAMYVDSPCLSLLLWQSLQSVLACLPLSCQPASSWSKPFSPPLSDFQPMMS